MPKDAGGIYYVVAAAVMISEIEAARAAAMASIAKPGRKRPFHWCTGGPGARNAITDTLIELGAIAHGCVHYPTGRKKQASARDKALTTIVPKLVHEGAEQLVIESRREVNDVRDERVIQRVLTEIEYPDALPLREWRTKTEPLIWFADAICGAVSDYLLGAEARHFHQLNDAGVLALEYITESVLLKEQVPVPTLGGDIVTLG